MAVSVALAVLAQAVTHPSGPGNSGAISAFKEACIQGSLKMSAERGRVLNNEGAPAVTNRYEWGRSIAHQTIVRLKEAPASYIVLTDFKKLQRKSIAKSCTLVSHDVSKDEAAAAFLEGLPEKLGTPKWWPNMYIPEWTSDHPELGYRKSLRFEGDGTVVLQVGMYPNAAAEMNAGKGKQ